jgi:hypothetical protein
MTITAVSSGQAVSGMTISGTGITAGTKIVQQLTGNQFGAGTYQVDTSQTAGATAITAGSADTNMPASDKCEYSTTEKLLAVLTWDVNTNCTSVELWCWESGTGIWTRIGKRTLTYDALWNVTAAPWS